MSADCSAAGSATSVLAPSVLALAVWSSAFTSVAIATGFERRYGVLERLAATPLGRPGLLAGKALATCDRAGPAGDPVGGGVGARLAPTFHRRLVLSSVRGRAGDRAFAALALLLAGRLRAEVTLALANVIYVVLLVGGGLVIPVDRFRRPCGR